MSKEILIYGAVKGLDRNYNYKIDKNGDLYKEKYSILKDPYTLVTICILILGAFYYDSINNNPLAVKNIDSTCEGVLEVCGKYIPLKDLWIEQHPGEEPNVRDIIDAKIKVTSTGQEINLSSINISLVYK